MTSQVPYELLFVSSDVPRLAKLSTSRDRVQHALDRGELPPLDVAFETARELLALWRTVSQHRGDVWVVSPHDDGSPPLFTGLEAPVANSLFVFEVAQVVRLYARVAAAVAMDSLYRVASDLDCVCSHWPHSPSGSSGSSRVFDHLVRARAYMRFVREHVFVQWARQEASLEALAGDTERTPEHALVHAYAKALTVGEWENFAHLLGVYADMACELDNWCKAYTSPNPTLVLDACRVALACAQATEHTFWCLEMQRRAVNTTAAGHTPTTDLRRLDVAKAALYPGYPTSGLQLRCLAHVVGARYFRLISDFPAAAWSLHSVEPYTMVGDRLDAISKLADEAELDEMDLSKVPATWAKVVESAVLDIEPAVQLPVEKLELFRGLSVDAPSDRDCAPVEP